MSLTYLTYFEICHLINVPQISDSPADKFQNVNLIQRSLNSFTIAVNFQSTTCTLLFNRPLAQFILEQEQINSAINTSPVDGSQQVIQPASHPVSQLTTEAVKVASCYLWSKC